MHRTSLTRCSDRSLLRSRSAPISLVVVANSVPGRFDCSLELASSRGCQVYISAFHASFGCSLELASPVCRVYRFSCKLEAFRSLMVYVHSMVHAALQAPCRLVLILDRADQSCRRSLSWKFAGSQMRNRFFKSSKVCEKNSWMHCSCTTVLKGNLLQTPPQWINHTVSVSGAATFSMDWNDYGAPRAHAHLVVPAAKILVEKETCRMKNSCLRGDQSHRFWCPWGAAHKRTLKGIVCWPKQDEKMYEKSEYSGVTIRSKGRHGVSCWLGGGLG